MNLYVATNGLDTNPGTAEAPLKTLQKAADTAVAGDVVTARAGNYVGFVLGWDYEKSGTPGNPIVFRGEPGAMIVGRNAKTGDGINIEQGSWITIEGFTLSGMNRAGIRAVQGSNVVIRNNVVTNNGLWGIFTSHLADLLVEGNIASKSVKEHGIYVSNSGDRPVIRNNVSFENRGCGIQVNSDASQGGDGIISNALIEGNTIYENGYRGSGLNCDGVQNSLIRNNLLYNNHNSGISLYWIDAAEPAINNTVVFNTIVNAADSRGAALNIQGGSTGTTILNNILMTRSTYWRTGLIISPESMPGTVSDYNVLSPIVIGGPTDDYRTVAEWQALSGMDLHSITAMPNTLGFVNEAANNYGLAKTSAAVDAGTPIGSAGYVISGAAGYAGRSVDIGAREFILPFQRPVQRWPNRQRP